jgi:ATP-dependent Clp protease ATP-binding subunit ClpC
VTDEPYDDEDEDEAEDDEDPVSLAVRTSESLDERYDIYQDDEAFEDADFVTAVARIREADRSVLDRLARDNRPYIAALALAATAEGSGRPKGWIDRAVARLRKGGAAETRFVLDLMASVREPVLARVLALVDETWAGTLLAPALGEFVERRVAAGDTARGVEIDFDPDGEPVIREALAGVGDAANGAVTALLQAWRARDVELDFFASVGRPVELEGAAPLLVGARATAVDLVEDAVRAQPPRSVLLVGDTGVGKTALLREALRRLAPSGWVGFEAAASDVMAGQMYIGMMEGRVQEIAQHMSGRPVAWLFPAFEEALWAGQHSQSPKGLLDALLPFVEARQVVVLAEIDPTAFALLAQTRPRVIRAFEVIRLPPMREQEAVAVAASYVESLALDVPTETLREALDLATHYLPGTAAPGNVLRLLELTVQRGERLGRVEVTPQTTTDTLSEATGLPLRVLDPRIPLDLEDVRAFFSGRVLGQPEAVDCLADRIALVKAGLTDPTKPLGVFLFVGPTGTGKTEIAKALAEYLFGTTERLVRLDMSEFQTPESLERLLSDSSMESNAAALVSSVRKQPFSVVLLDEFEKAHANVWDVFLQVFDDGRLTDRSGRTVDFRHCVVILTSNIGSAIPRTAALGFGSVAGGFDAAGVEREVARQFRPELLNRLDRVVVFRPLQRELMRELVELELTRTLGRRGFRAQPWAVEWDDAAIDFLVERGFSAELGARPLKRAIERHLLAPLARTIVERRFPEGDQFLFITASASGGIRVRFVDPDAEPGAAAPAPDREWTLAGLALDPDGAAGASGFVVAELGRVERRLEPWRTRKQEALASTLEPGFWDAADRTTLGTIELLDRIEAAFATAQRLGARLERRAGGADVVRLVAERLYLLDAALDALEAGEPPDALVRVAPSPSSVDPSAASGFANEIRGMYRRWAGLRGMRLHELGGGLGVSGLGAYRILRPEAGLHVLEVPGEHRTFARIAAHVVVSPWPVTATVEEAGASAAADAVEDTGEIRVVRRYRREPSALVRDSRGWRTGRIDDVLGGAFDLLGDAGDR